MKYLILIIFFLGVSCGRQRETDLVLDNARALMRDEPARALALLRTLRTEHLKRASSRAQYALLYSQALDKNRIFRTDDSLIRIAVRYYESRDTPHEKASAYYYLGRIYDNRCDKIGAAEALFHAQAHVSETDDDYLRGQIAFSIGLLYSNQLSYEEALGYLKRSNRHFLKAGQRLNTAISLEWLGHVYLNLHDNYRSDSCLREASALYEQLGMSDDLLRAQLNRSWILMKEVGTDSVRRYVDALFARHSPHLSPSTQWGLMLSLHFKEGNLDSARAYGLKCIGAADRASGYTIADCYSLLEQIEFAAGNYKKAQDYAYTYCRIIDSMNALKNRTFMQEIEQRCQNKLLTSHNEALAVQRHYQSIVILLLTIIFTIGIWIAIRAFCRWQKRAHEQIRQAETELCSLRTTYDGLQKRMASLQEQSDKDDLQETQLYKALEERMIGLRELIASSQTIKPSLFIKNFQKYVGVNVNSRHALTDLQYVVNRKYNGVVDYLKAHYPELTKHDLDLCCLLCFGFSQQAICYMYDYGDIGSFYNKRSRLRHKLKLPADYKIEDFFTDLLRQLAPRAQ